MDAVLGVCPCVCVSFFAEGAGGGGPALLNA